jgi:hypothetical protein
MRRPRCRRSVCPGRTGRHRPIGTKRLPPLRAISGCTNAARPSTDDLPPRSAATAAAVREGRRAVCADPQQRACLHPAPAPARANQPQNMAFRRSPGLCAQETIARRHGPTSRTARSSPTPSSGTSTPRYLLTSSSTWSASSSSPLTSNQTVRAWPTRDTTASRSPASADGPPLPKRFPLRPGPAASPRRRLSVADGQATPNVTRGCPGHASPHRRDWAPGVVPAGGTTPRGWGVKSSNGCARARATGYGSSTH